MGDRFSFGVTDRGGDVLYLYSHWGGVDWDTNLKTALYGQVHTVRLANVLTVSLCLG